MWRQQVSDQESKEQSCTPEGNARRDSSIPEEALQNVDQDQEPFYPNGSTGHFPYPGVPNGFSLQSGNDHNSLSLHTGPSLTDAGSSNVDSMSSTGGYSPPVNPLVAAPCPHSTPIVASPGFAVPMNGFPEHTNVNAEASFPPRDKPWSSYGHHLPGCPHAHNLQVPWPLPMPEAPFPSRMQQQAHTAQSLCYNQHAPVTTSFPQTANALHNLTAGMTGSGGSAYNMGRSQGLSDHNPSTSFHEFHQYPSGSWIPK